MIFSRFSTKIMVPRSWMLSFEDLSWVCENIEDHNSLCINTTQYRQTTFRHHFYFRVYKHGGHGEVAEFFCWYTHFKIGHHHLSSTFIIHVIFVGIFSFFIFSVLCNMQAVLSSLLYHTDIMPIGLPCPIWKPVLDIFIPELPGLVLQLMISRQ